MLFAQLWMAMISGWKMEWRLQSQWLYRPILHLPDSDTQVVARQPGPKKRTIKEEN